MGVLVQVISTALLCLACMNLGFSIAWPSSTVLLFKSENTTLHRPMSDLDVTLFSTLPLIGALIAQPLILVSTLDKLGLKRTMMLIFMVFVIAWTIITLSNRVEAILLAVFISGGGYASFTVVSMYISEIVQDSIRGTLISGTNLSCSFGIMVSYLLGGILDYYKMVYFCLSLPVIGVLAMVVLKDSPVRLMAKGKEEEAAKALAFYRQTSSTSKEVLTEMNNIRRSLNMELEDAQSLARLEESVNLEIKHKKLSCWQLFKTTPSIRRQFYLVMVLHTSFEYQGLPSMQVYAEPIFTTIVGDDFISPNTCSVLLGLVLLIAGTIGAYLTDSVGRRPLQMYTSIVNGVCCLCLGTQVITGWFPIWTILLIIYVYTTSHTIGAGTVPFVVSAEVFLPEVKSKLLILIYEWSCFCSFSCLLLLNILMQSFGLAPVFYIFSMVCFVTAVYFFYFLPETKGLPVYAIQALFNKEVKKIDK